MSRALSGSCSALSFDFALEIEMVAVVEVDEAAAAVVS